MKQLVRHYLESRRPVDGYSKRAKRFLRLVFLGSMNLNISFRTNPVPLAAQIHVPSIACANGHLVIH